MSRHTPTVATLSMLSLHPQSSPRRSFEWSIGSLADEVPRWIVQRRMTNGPRVAGSLTCRVLTHSECSVFVVPTARLDSRATRELACSAEHLSPDYMARHQLEVVVD